MVMPPALKKYWAEKRKNKKSSTKKGGARKYIRKAYEKSKQLRPKLKRKKANKPRKKSSNSLKLPKVPSILKKVAMGLGAAALATMVVGIFAPQFVPIAKPVAALVAGGIPGVAAELVIDQGILGNISGFLGGGGGGINQQRLVSGL